MSYELYVRYVGAYGGRDVYAEERLVKAGFSRIKVKGDSDQFWLSSLILAKGDLEKEIGQVKGDKAKQTRALSWVKSNAHAGQIAVVKEMWGAGPD